MKTNPDQRVMKSLTAMCLVSEREAEILKPLASVEVVEKEEASFDTEISEDDVAGEWKLRGQVLIRSPVRSTGFLSLTWLPPLGER